ncbi:MAG: phosphohydrolase, partial [Chloroflexota bacterium]
MGDVVLVTRAYAFAAERHTGQFRKGKKREEAYINHPIEVAELVTIATKGKDHTLIAAAVLH